VWWLWKPAEALIIGAGRSLNWGIEYLRKTVDIQHRRWRYAIIILLLGLCELAGLLTHSILKTSPPHSLNSGLGSVLFSGTFAVIAFLSVLTVVFGPGFFLPFYRRALNDELLRALHARVARFGYVLTIIEVSAVLVMAAYKPQLVVAALPSVIAAAIALPGIYFLILDWRTDRNE